MATRVKLRKEAANYASTGCAKILKNQSATNSTVGERNACSANITARRHRRRWGRYVSSDTVTVMTQFWAVELIPAAGRSGQATLKRRAPLAQTLKRSIRRSYRVCEARARKSIIYYILIGPQPSYTPLPSDNTRAHAQ